MDLNIWPYIAIFIVGVALTVWRERRAFYRRNEAGIEEFDSFGSALSAKVIENTAYIFGRIFLGVGVLGIILSLIVN